MTAKLAASLRLMGLALLLPLLAACGGAEAPERGPTVLAASSLQGALEEAAGAWTARGHPAPVLSFAATSALARQAEQGAPADLFVSADQDWMDTLEQEGLLRAGTRRDLLRNRLVLVTRRGGAARSIGELGDGRLALADPGAVPAGKYARAALESLGEWDALEGRIVPAENVRAALALVERGEAPLGIVYATDAIASERVEVLRELPEASHPPIRYPAAVLAGSEHPDAAGLLAFLSSAEAMRIFERHGFGTIE
jgi:molybdate transport system substrate-binding protein